MNRSMTMTTAAALTGLTLFVTACTGGAGSDGKDARDGKDGKKGGASTNASSGGGTGKAGGADADKALKTRKCLREHGLDVPDPAPGQDPRGMTLGSGGEDPEAVKKAFDACGLQAPGSGQVSQEDKDKALKWAKCMRDNGVNVPDPTFNGSAMSATRIPEGQEQAFQDAQKKCEAA